MNFVLPCRNSRDTVGAAHDPAGLLILDFAPALAAACAKFARAGVRGGDGGSAGPS